MSSQRIEQPEHMQRWWRALALFDQHKDHPLPEVSDVYWQEVDRLLHIAIATNRRAELEEGHG